MKNSQHYMPESRIRLLLLAAALSVASVFAFSQAVSSPQPPAAQPRGNDNQDWATAKLDKSPRHQEWVTITNGGNTLHGWVVYPEVKTKVPVILVLHEVFGLTDSTRNTADEIAAMGYIAITPDMLSGLGPNGGGSGTFTEAERRGANVLTSRSDESVNSDLNAWADYGLKLPQANGKFAVLGLSWGGGASFRYAAETKRSDLKAAFVFYDVGPPAVTQKYDGAPASISVANLKVPVYGFYPTKDTRTMAALQATKDAMAAAGKTLDPVLYEGAEHAFMRIGEDPRNSNPANAEAVKESLARLEKLLKTL